MSTPLRVVYCTGNRFKIEEGERIIETMTVTSIKGVVRVKDHLSFEVMAIRTSEPMERSIVTLVEQKTKSAYRQLMVPCIVEYAGLIFSDGVSGEFPGGLTQSIWNALGADRFVTEFARPGRVAVARAVVGYCDGLRVRTFVGETAGSISAGPRGSRRYDWDTVFCPEGESGKTYAEIVEDPSKGLDHKVRISQSTKAFSQFFKYRLDADDVEVFFQ